jgi:hypothetical protein
MRDGLVAIVVFALTCSGCSDPAKSKGEADAARAAQAKAEAEAAAARAAQAQAEAALAKIKGKPAPANDKTGKVEPAAKAARAAPRQVAPANGSELNQVPRKTMVRWAPVAGAAKYKVEVEYEDPGAAQWTPYAPKETTSTEYQFDFVGAQPGRWRVSAVDDSGREGPKSDWWTFRYTQ